MILNDIHDESLKKDNVRTGSTQDYLDIAEIKQDTIILNNGSLRCVIMCSAINFALKSTQEQEGLIFGYQKFLNSLDFPIQIVVNSRLIDLSEYLYSLKKKYENQENELLKLQIAEYRDFIKSLIEVSNIMDKKFYIVIPFSFGESKSASFLEKIQTSFQPKQVLNQSEKDFTRYKGQLLDRVNHVVGSLGGMGIESIPLKTQELIELYYSLYNPSGVVGQGGVPQLNKLDIDSKGFN